MTIGPVGWVMMRGGCHRGSVHSAVTISPEPLWGSWTWDAERTVAFSCDLVVYTLACSPSLVLDYKPYRNDVLCFSITQCGFRPSGIRSHPVI